MSQKKSILVATIGTRDLAYQDSSRDWLNVGNDRAEGGKSQMGQVKEDLSTEPGTPLGFLNCLNFLSEYKSSSLKNASLMPLVHEELKEAIASYHP